MSWQLINRYNINENKWNELVSLSRSRHITGLSWYLDIVSPQWYGLVWDDYQIIFPFAKKTKLFFPYFLQPPMITYFRPFSLIDINGEIFQSLISVIKKKVIFADFYIDDLGFKSKYISDCRINYLLRLEDIEDLRSMMSEHHLRKIKKMEKNEPCLIQLTNVPTNFLNDFLCNSPYMLNETELRNIIIKLGKNIEQYQLGGWWGLKIKDTIMAIALISIYHDILVFHSFTANDKGRKSGATHYLIYKIIENFKKSNGKIIDFDGGNEEKMAFFYQGFGGKPYKYLELKIKKW